MNVLRTKLLNQSGDYYYCSSCQAWHTLKPGTKGQQHLGYFDESETNSDSAKYYFCTLCNKWHKGAHTAHHSHRAHIESDGKLKVGPQKEGYGNLPTVRLYSFPSVLKITPKKKTNLNTYPIILFYSALVKTADSPNVFV